MAIRRVSLLVAVTGIFVLAASGSANAAALRVSGALIETSSGTCGEPVWTGAVATIHCVGLAETWTGDISGTGVFDEAVSLNFFSGEVHVSGTETFRGCVGGSCGTLESAYQGSGRLNLETFAVVFISGEQHFTDGTGGLETAKGSVRFSLIGEGPSSYQGLIVI
jgi:hypothetical protein